MKKVILFLFFVSFCFAQNKLIDFDYALFKNDSLSTNMELYYSVKQNQLKTSVVDNQKMINAILRIEITNTKTNKVELTNDWKLNYPINDEEAAKNLVGVLNFTLLEGEYKFKIELIDNNKSDNINNVTETIKINTFSDISISDLELATNIKRENINPESIFIKNNLEVIPNPEMIYVEANPVVFYYFEMYNLKNAGSEKFNLNVKIIDNKNNIVSEKNKNLTEYFSNQMEFGLFNISKLFAGSYNILVTLTDANNQTIAKKIKRFYYLSSKIQEDNNNIVASKDFMSEFYGFSDEECDLHIDQVRYIIKDDERKEYVKITELDSKRKFLIDFWKIRDQIKETEINEYQIEFMNRLKFVNENYHAFKKKGYLTDRGRVHLLYGKPDNIMRYPFEPNKKPYEIWEYEAIEGGVLFVFIDHSDYGLYELATSTKRGEINDQNWEERLYK